jgi:hypothetical protein
MTGLTLDDPKELAGQGGLIELEASLMMPLMHFVHGEVPADPRDIAATMRAVGPEHCFMVSDLGQLYSPVPVEGMRTYVAMLLKCGLTAKEIEVMLHRNPARILGLE